MSRIIKGVGVDFVMKELPPYYARMKNPANDATSFSAYAMRGLPILPVTSQQVAFSLDRLHSDLAKAEFEALFREFSKGSRTWHLHQLTETRLPVARFRQANLVTEARLPAVIATVIGSQLRGYTGGGFSIESHPGMADLFVEEDRRSELRIAVCALVPGPEPQRVLLWTQTTPFLGRLRMRLKPGRAIEDIYPQPDYFDKLGKGVAAIMSTLIDGASLLLP